MLQISKKKDVSHNPEAIPNNNRFGGKKNFQCIVSLEENVFLNLQMNDYPQCIFIYDPDGLHQQSKTDHLICPLRPNM